MPVLYLVLLDRLLSVTGPQIDAPPIVVCIDRGASDAERLRWLLPFSLGQHWQEPANTVNAEHGLQCSQQRETELSTKSDIQVRLTGSCTPARKRAAR